MMNTALFAFITCETVHPVLSRVQQAILFCKDLEVTDGVFPPGAPQCAPINWNLMFVYGWWNFLGKIYMQRNA